MPRKSVRQLADCHKIAIMELVKKPDFFSYLPSKKFITIVFLLALSAGALFYLGKFVKLKPDLNASLKNIVNQGFVSELAKRTENLDSDNDGLKDWEEALWKSDPKKSDTDGDGLSDKDEVAGGYDPADTASNSKTGKKIQKVNYPVVADNLEPGNLTQSLAQSIGMKIMNGTDANPLSVNDALSSINQETSQGLAEFEASFHKTVYDSELKISSDNSITAMQEYFQKISDILSRDPFYTQSESPVDLSGINISLIDGYLVYITGAINDVKNIPVPSDFLQDHKKGLEILMSNKEVFLNIRKMNEDPLRAMLAINQLEKNMNELEKLGNSLANLIKSH